MRKFYQEIKKLKDKPEECMLNIKLYNHKIQLIPAKVSQENGKLITRWRKENWIWFLTKFNVTANGSFLWLEKIWSNPERILFMIIVDGKKIGHIGIYNYNKKNTSVEIDSVLKGVKTSEKQTMNKAVLILFNWIFNDLKIKIIQLEVFSENYRAINLYENLGLSIINSIPLKKVETPDGWIWKKTKPKKNEIGQRYLNIMRISKNDFIKLQRLGDNSF